MIWCMQIYYSGHWKWWALQCKDKTPKFQNKYSQKRNIGVSVPISTFMRLCAIYIFPRSVCLFCWRKYVDRSWDYINRSQTHECWNWGWGRAIPRKVIHKWNFPCSVIILTFWSILVLSLFVREAVYSESVPARAKLLARHNTWCESPCPRGSLPRIPPWPGRCQTPWQAPSQPYSWSTLVWVSLSRRQSTQNPSLTRQVPNSLARHLLNLIHGIPLCGSPGPGGSLPRIPLWPGMGPNSFARHLLNLIMEYLGVSLLVREAVYPESLPDPASTKLLGKAPSKSYSWNTFVWVSLSGRQSTQNPSLTRQVPNSLSRHLLNLIMKYLGVSLLVREAVYPESLPDPAGAKLLRRQRLNLLEIFCTRKPLMCCFLFLPFFNSWYLS